ncbi:MAG: TolC family protein [Burkholderiales bacterium]
MTPKFGSCVHMVLWVVLLFLIGGMPPVAAQDGAPLALDEAIELGLVRSYRVASQRAAVDAAHEMSARAGALPDPKLRFGIENLPITDTDRFRYDRESMTMRRIGVMQEFPNAGKRDAARLRARSEAVAERVALARERVQLRREVGAAWVDRALAEAAQLRLAELEAQVRFEVDASAPALTAGRVTAAEVHALRGALEMIRDRAIAQERLVERASIDLVRLIGEPARRSNAPLPDFTRAAFTSAELDVRLATHPAILVAGTQLRIASAEVDAARAGKSPDWAVELSYSQREPSFSNMVSLMVQVDLPLWQAKRQDRDVAARVAGLERMRGQRDEAYRSAEAELRLLLADFSAAHRRVEHHRGVSLPIARERTGGALAAYRGGRGALSAVLEARRAETELDIDTLALERERALAWVSLRYAFLTDQDLAEAGRED